MSSNDSDSEVGGERTDLGETGFDAITFGLLALALMACGLLLTRQMEARGPKSVRQPQ